MGCTEDTSAAEPGEVLASADADEVVELMKERSGSHLVEVWRLRSLFRFPFKLRLL